MVCSERFQIRLSPDDRRRLDVLASETRRTPSDVLRLLVRSASEPDVVAQSALAQDAFRPDRRRESELAGATS